MDEGTDSTRCHEARGRMKDRGKLVGKPSEAGIALLIAIFVLMLVSVVAMALMLSSSTETALGSNFRSSSSAYYAALAGLEEGRGRLLSKNPSNFNATDPGFMPAPGTTLAVGQPRYILNPAPGENVVPWDLGTPATYPDTEYQVEFGAAPPNPSPTANSVSTVAGIPGPLYKWVRINAVTEQSLNIDVDGVGGKDGVTPLFYDPMHLDGGGNVKPSLIVTATPPASAVQAFEITAFAALPDGSQKLLQYVVAGTNWSLSFPAALTLLGPVGTQGAPPPGVFNASGNSDFMIGGIDQQDGGTCTPNDGTKYAVGVTGSGPFGSLTTNETNVKNGIPPSRYGNYIGSGGSGSQPSLGDVTASLIPQFQTVSGLDGPQGLIQMIAGIADHVVTNPPNPPADDLPDFGSPTKMVTTVVNGDMTLSDSANGYGLLVVTGNLTLYGGASWHGIILAVGQGSVTFPSYHYGKIDGAFLLAQTRDAHNNPLANFGQVNFNTKDPNEGNNGIWYNSCWIRAAAAVTGYKVLSFREIPQ
jgi:hypothetical protein